MSSLVMVRIVLFLQKVLDLYSWVIVIWALLSWFPIRPGSLVDDIRAAMGKLVEPFLGLIRRFLPPVMGVDFSPVVAILILSLIEQFVLPLLL